MDIDKIINGRESADTVDGIAQSVNNEVLTEQPADKKSSVKKGSKSKRETPRKAQTGKPREQGETSCKGTHNKPSVPSLSKHYLHPLRILTYLVQDLYCS